MKLTLHGVLFLAAVVLMCFAAFKVTWGTDTVIWFDLAWATALAGVTALVSRK